MDLHGKIMNIQVDEDRQDKAISEALDCFDAYEDVLEAVYRRAHRDARHEAAKLVVENREGVFNFKGDGLPCHK